MAKILSKGKLSDDLVKQVGQLSYRRKDLLGSGSFGTVFRGKLKHASTENKPDIDVAIKRIEEINAREIETVVIGNLEPHPNVLQYYCIEEDYDFM